MRIGKEIALEAKKKGICGPWYKDMLMVTTFKHLAEMYFKGDDWAMEHDFPTLEMCRTYKGGILPYKMITDEKIAALNLREAAFFGDCKVQYTVDGFNVSKINVRHNSELNIVAKDDSILFINLLDDAKVDIDVWDNAQVTVYCYTNRDQITFNGNVKIKMKSWEK